MMHQDFLNQMKKTRKYFSLILSLIIFLSFPVIARADEFYSLNIKVSIDENGLAEVNEIWDTVDEEGTEKYKPIENLGDIQIKDFKASVNGEDFVQESPWDVDKSFDQKSYKYGINPTDNGLELCWGISNYGHNIHQISYKVSPIVIELNDYDMVYWKFINDSMDPMPDEASIKISGFEPFDEDVKMWGFGMEGEIHNQDGNIVMESSGLIDYGVIMLRFPKGYFQTPYKIDENFKYYADMAIEGSDWEENQGQVSNEDSGFPLIAGIAIFLLVILSSIGIVQKASSSSIMGRLDPDKKLPKAKSLKGEYFQEVPYEDPIENIYIFVKKAYPRIKQDDFLNAYILKWIYQDNIDIKEEDKGIFKKNTNTIIIKSTPENMGELEKSFFNKLLGSKKYGQADQIDQKAFEKYIRIHTSEMETFFDKFELNSSIKLKDEGYINERREKKLFGKTTYLDPSLEGIDLYSNLIKFKNYLEDYSLIKERDISEVKIWDYFMIYAAIFGISEQVFKNLEKTYPEYTRYSAYTYNRIIWSRSYARSVQTSYNSFMSAGYGGSTSFGGGGGSFGGGSGGGSR